MCGVRLNPWVLVTMTIFLLAGTSVSQDEMGFPYKACDFRKWENSTPAATPGNCDVECEPDEYYNEENNSCDSCPPDHRSVYGRALWFPFGEDACEPEAICIQDDDACHKCSPVPFPPFAGTYQRCECRSGFSVERAEVDDNVFFVCKRDCEEENGGCQQKCEDGEGDKEAKCSCAEGFKEKEDGEMCIDIDECMTGKNECRLPNQCQNYEGGYKCRCAFGWMPSPDGKRCKRADELVCTISIMEITAPYEMDPKDSKFGELTDTEDKKFDPSRIESMFREVLSQTGMWALKVDVVPTFVNGHLEFLVMMQFSPQLGVEQETRVLAALSERLARSGYYTEMDGKSVYISRPVYCFSKNTGGIPLTIDDMCMWYDAAGYCLQNSHCRQDGGEAFCLCPYGWYGKRCEMGQITTVDIVLIVVVVILNIKFLVLCCYVCIRLRRRNSECRSEKKKCLTKAYATPQVIQQAFPTPIKYQAGALMGGVVTYGRCN